MPVRLRRARVMDFDTEKFILEIKERPAIWDSKCADYADRNKKIKCWEEIINLHAKEEDTSEEKKEVGKVLMKKWRNIKDNFVKASKNLINMKNGSAAKQKSPYIYYNILLFLKDSTIVNDTESDIANDVSRTNDGSCETAQNPIRRKKNIEKKKIGKKMVSVVRKKLKYKKEMGNDEDKLFLLSLLGEFKRIPETNKLEARCDIIRAIKKAQQPSFHYNYPITQFDRSQMNDNEYAGREYQTHDTDFTSQGCESRVNKLTTTSCQNRSNQPSTSTYEINIKEEATQESASQEDSLMSELFNSP